MPSYRRSTGVNQEELLRTIRWLAIPVLAIALVTAACGGDDDTDSTTPTGTPATGTEGTSTPTAGSEGTAGTPASGGDDVNLEEIFRGYGQTSFNVTYRIDGTTTGVEAGDEELAGEWTWIQDIEGNRTRFEATQDGEAVIMITTPERTLLCADGGCFDAGAMMGGMAPPLEEMLTGSLDEVQQDATTSTVRRIDGRTVAGTDTECVEFEDDAEGAQGILCYAEGGIPLYVESTSADGTFRMEALRYSSDVSDDDFEPPFPVTSLGG